MGLICRRYPMMSRVLHIAFIITGGTYKLFKAKQKKFSLPATLEPVTGA